MILIRVGLIRVGLIRVGLIRVGLIRVGWKPGQRYAFLRPGYWSKRGRTCGT
jgi:hypothetical protein